MFWQESILHNGQNPCIIHSIVLIVCPINSIMSVISTTVIYTYINILSVPFFSNYIFGILQPSVSFAFLFAQGSFICFSITHCKKALSF